MAGNTNAPYGVWVEPQFLEALSNYFGPTAVFANPVKFSAPGPVREKFWLSRKKAQSVLGDEVKFFCGADNVDLDVYGSASECREMLEHYAREEKGVVTLVFVCP